MNVGTLTIEIAAGVARLQADMNDAKRVVTTATKETEAAVGFLKTACPLLCAYWFCEGEPHSAAELIFRAPAGDQAGRLSLRLPRSVVDSFWVR